MVQRTTAFDSPNLLTRLSLVSDLGPGLPPEDAMRSCLVDAALASELDLHDSGDEARSAKPS